MNSIFENMVAHQSDTGSSLSTSKGATLKHDDNTHPAFTFRKATNVAGKFGERPGRRPPIIFDGGASAIKEPTPKTAATSSLIKTSPSKLPTVLDLDTLNKANNRKTADAIPAHDKSYGMADSDSLSCLEIPTKGLITRDNNGTCFPFADDGKSPLQSFRAMASESRSTGKIPRIPTMSPAFIVPVDDRGKTDTSSGSLSNRQTPSIVGDLETAPICNPRQLLEVHSRKTVESGYVSKAKRRSAVPSSGRKENKVSVCKFPPRPSSRASNISRRRVNIARDWASKSDDEKQLQNVASTLNAWAEHNNYQRAKFNETIDTFEKKINSLERELGDSRAILKDNEDQISELEAEKRHNEDHNNNLKKKLGQLEEKMEKQNAIINQFEQDSKTTMEQIAQLLDHVGIKEDIEDIPTRFLRATEAFDDCSNQLAEHQIALSKTERTKENSDRKLEQKDQELKALKCQYENRIGELNNEIRVKDDEILSRESRISQLVQKAEDDKSLKEQNENIDHRMNEILGHLTLVLERVESGPTTHSDLTEKLNSILLSVQGRNTELDRNDLLQEYLEKFKDLCKHTENDILMSLSDTVSKTTGSHQAQAERYLQSILQDQTCSVSKLIQEHEDRLNETITRSRTEERLSDSLKELQGALAEAQRTQHETEKELAVKSCHLESALQKINEATQLKHENHTLRETVDSLRTAKANSAEERSKSIEVLQHQLMRCISSQLQLEFDLREREKVSLDLQATLLAQEQKILAAEKALEEAASGLGEEKEKSAAQVFEIETDKIAQLNRELTHSNQRLANLTGKLKKYEAMLQDAHEALREWKSHKQSLVSLQEGLKNIGVSSVDTICSRLEALWKFKSDAITREEGEPSKNEDVVGEVSEIPHSLPAVDFKLDVGDEVFPDIDIQDILDSLDHVQGPKPTGKNNATPVETSNTTLTQPQPQPQPSAQQSALEHEELSRLRRIVIKSPGEMDPPIAPTIEEEKVTRRTAAAPTSILKFRSNEVSTIGATPGITFSDSETAFDASADRQAQLRGSFRNQYNRPVMSSTLANYSSAGVSVSALAAASASTYATTSGISTTDEIRRSLTVSKGVFTCSSSSSDLDNQNRNRVRKRPKEDEQLDGAAKNARNDHVSSPGSSSSTKSGYFKNILRSRSLSGKIMK
ncbi:hypothetical protein Cpir12675_000348 [Ceratocystis pirilliformis]|uniref:Uncharacterized protein n=1 Tax=Ceratocystis pirilliformis TaxID=259994 RepID=A0ABR3ZLR5_9PEZI